MDNDFFLNSGNQPQLHFDSSSDSFFNPNFDNSMDQFSNFESALSSIVSSPAASNSAVSNESFQIRELIGKLGGICNSGEISPVLAAYGSNSTSNSCYTTPMNSPPKLGNSIGVKNPNYPPVSADPGFAERAAKFSCFGSRSFNSRTSHLGQNTDELGSYRSNNNNNNNSTTTTLSMGNVKLTRNLSSPSLNEDGSPMSAREMNKSFGQNQCEIGFPPAPVQIPDSSSRKRKAVSRGKSKESKIPEENEISKSKRHKDDEGIWNEKGSSKTEVLKQGKVNNGAETEEAKPNTKLPEPPKDYIHVRARRGQATDSHSLAERVRREKISERMKFLQDLVPGCNKVTGKALMLDEIINYVQSLQRQVEFLSMKLATVNPRMDFNMDNVLPKDEIQANGSLAYQMNLLGTSASPFFGHHTQKMPRVHNHGAMMDPHLTNFRQNIGLQIHQVDEYGQGLAQFPTLCEDDLQSILQMGFVHDSAVNPQGFPGTSQASHMKVEL